MSLVEGLHTQFLVGHALILRETRTRYGAHRLGYLWAVLEPLFWVATFYGIFLYTNKTLPYGMDVVGFIATGIVPFQVFRESVGHSVGAIKTNKPLLYYPQVRPLDLVLSRNVLELFTLSLVFLIIMSGYALFEGGIAVDKPLWMVGGFVLAWLLGASLGLFFMGAAIFFAVTERLVGILMRPLFFVSGIFFSANELPQTVREYLLWNPVLHAVEMTRDGLFKSYHAHYLDLAYVLGWILILFYLGLLLERMGRRHVRLT